VNDEADIHASHLDSIIACSRHKGTAVMEVRLRRRLIDQINNTIRVFQALPIADERAIREREQGVDVGGGDEAI